MMDVLSSHIQDPATPLRFEMPSVSDFAAILSTYLLTCNIRHCFCRSKLKRSSICFFAIF